MNSSNDTSETITFIDDTNSEVASKINKDLDLENFSEKMRVEKLDEKSEYLKTPDGKIFRKSALCWFLNDSTEKLSSDRLIRVKQCDDLKKSLVVNTNINEVKEQEYIAIGDWCLFDKLYKEEDGSQLSLIGRVLDFAYMSQSTWRQTEYNKTFINIKSLKTKINSSRSEDQIATTKKILGVICQWFEITDCKDPYLTAASLKFHGLIDVCQYRLSQEKHYLE